MKSFRFYVLSFVLAILPLSNTISAQQYVSLDKTVTVNSIKVITPTGSFWENPNDYSILLVDVNTDMREVGGEKDNLAKHAVLLSKKQLAQIKADVQSKGTCFIPKLASYHAFYLPAYQKEADLLFNVNGALFIHDLTLQSNPNTTVYEYCHHRSCPDSISHEVISSFQITKSGGKYYLITGMSNNSGGKPIPWNVEDIKQTGGFGELAIELTAAQYNSLF